MLQHKRTPPPLQTMVLVLLHGENGLGLFGGELVLGLLNPLFVLE